MMLSEVSKKSNVPTSNERGAALITTLMIATLVLAAGGALILSTNMSATTAVDSTAEMQAYYGAEAGLQQALNVLRGNVASHNVAGTPKMTFRNAVTLDKSNRAGDQATATRLSGWLVYDYRSPGATYDDRVKVNPTDNTYSPLTGIAFGLTISDPDATPVAAGDPPRLVINSIGYGPKGAMKRLEMVVQRNGINFTVPAAITVVGTSPMTFALDASNTPPFLASADATRLFLVQARDIAAGEGRYFTTGADAIAAGLGTSAAPLTTVIDNFGGNVVTLASGYQGCGLLIVTGDL